VFWNAHQYTEKDPARDDQMLDKLEKEASAILCTRWLPAMIEAVNRGGYANRDSWEETREKWTAEMDIFGKWFEESGLILREEEMIQKSIIFNLINWWQKDHKRPTMNEAEISKKLLWKFDRKVVSSRHRMSFASEEDKKRTPMYKGLCWGSDDEDIAKSKDYNARLQEEYSPST